MAAETTVSEGTRAAESAAPAAAAPVVSVRGLIKHFRRADGAVTPAIDDVSLDVHRGEFVVLLGPSGCGKTTLLRAIAGLERPDAGSVRLHGTTCFSEADRVNLPPEKRRVSMIFQSYALWPHMTAFDNVAYPLRHRADRKIRGRDQLAAEVGRVLSMVGIPELARQYPHQMSGGQQQRVALARALVAGDDLVLFDEPLSNVDAKVREQLRLELLSMQRELGFAALFVTHDQVEAMELAHRIAVMGGGRVVQAGTPREVYDRPRSRYVANFIGRANEVPGTVARTAEDGHVVVDTALGEVTATGGVATLAAGDAVVVTWRPERCALASEPSRDGNCWPARVVTSLFAGPQVEYVVAIGDARFRVSRPWGGEPLPEGTEGHLTVDRASVRALPATDPD